MNFENLISFLNNKETLDQKAISRIMLLIEKYPYFQTAHMLLLKAMQHSQSDKYNKQLKISGSFISDKRKLFQFINSSTFVDIPVKKETEKPVLKEEEAKKIAINKETKAVETPPIKTTEKKVETGIVKKPDTKQDEITKKQVTKIESVKKEESAIKKKVDIPESEIERIANENSKQKHHEIIKDFFHGENKPQTGKKVIESAVKEEKRDIPEKAKIKEVKLTEPEVKKPLPVVDQKKPEEPVKKEEKRIIEKKEIPEIKEEQTIKKTIETAETGKGTNDTMNNIFSKIRQIKKEMNISSESAPETIDVNNENKKPQLLKNTKPEEKKETSSGRIIKESFIGFSEEETGQSKTEIKEEEKKDVPEKKEEIKELELTAKDLFKQHLKKKEKVLYTEPERKSEKKETTETSKSHISKLVEIVNNKTTTENIKNKEIKETEPVTEKKEPIISSSSGTETVAEALIKRIAAKKLKIKEEQEKEEQKKQEEKQKELDAVNELVKGTKKIETEKEQEPEQYKNTKENQKKEDEILVKQKEENEITEISSPEDKKPNKLIDSFIEKAESLDRLGSKESKLTGDISLSSTTESEDFMTETYADLLIQQKKYEKAIAVYNKLILKFPEKKTYFAIQIKKVESLIK